MADGQPWLKYQGQSGTPTQQPAAGPWDRFKQQDSPQPEGGGAIDALWNYIKGSGESLKQAGREIPRDASALVGDAFRALLPTKEGAEAGGRVVSKLGDIGTFASGGLTGPMGMPTPPVAGLARGLDVKPRSTAAAPLVPPGVEAGAPSQLASAFTKNDPSAIDKALTSQYRKLVKPGFVGQRTGPGLATQDQRITTAVDSLIDAKDRVRFKDAQGNEMEAGRTPQSLDEFVQGIDHLKSQIYEEYDELAKQQGGQGVRVPLAPAVTQLQQLAMQPEVADLHPALAQQATELAQRWAQTGSYSPKEMQAVVQHLNEQLKNLQRNPTRETFSQSTMMNQVLSTLRATLNQTMEGALQGPQYQALRNRYASVVSIEGDVANALKQELAKAPGGIGDRLSDPAAIVSALHGVFFHDPKTIALAGAIEGSKYLQRYLRNPNRAVTRLFNKRAAALRPTMTERLSSRAAVGVGQAREAYTSVVGP